MIKNNAAVSDSSLAQSILHWERLLAAVAAGDRARLKEEGWGASDCPLCSAYYAGKKTICQDCPVKLKTGYPGCHNTPWRAAADALSEYVDYGVERNHTHLMVKRELDFLRALRVEREANKEEFWQEIARLLCVIKP